MVESKRAEEKTLERYELNANGMRTEVTIVDTGGFIISYNVSTPDISPATKLLIDSLRPELLSSVFVDPSRIQDTSYILELNKRYVSESEILLERYLPGIAPDTKKLLIAYILNMMLGLGDMEVPLVDEGLEEIAVNGAKEPLWVFHKKYGWCKSNITPVSEELIYDQAEQIGRRVGREINNLSPTMDAELPDGSRVNATLYPVSQSGNTLTIRKFSKNPWTMTAILKNNTVSPEVAALIWLCVQNEISLLISGGTASGKTSFLNALSIFFKSDRRVISIEDTRELAFPSFLQWVPMLSRLPNPEGKGEVSIYRLLVNSLRMRPDVLVVGEVRTSNDAQMLFEAIHTGHAVYGTLHADNAYDVVIRMTNPPINIPKITMNALGGIIVNFRHRARQVRRILEFGEVLDGGDVNVLYKWNAVEDRIMEISDMTRLAETLTLYTGMTAAEIKTDQTEKAEILLWMSENNIVGVDDAGFVISNYYKDKKKVLGFARNKTKFSRELF